MKLLLLITFLFSKSLFAGYCYDQETDSIINENSNRISHCWNIPKRFDYNRNKWFPTCNNTFALNLDPYLFGAEIYRQYWCPFGLDRSVVSGLEDFGWFSNDNECDAFNPISRLYSSFWFLKKISQSQKYYGGQHSSNWHTRVINLINDSGGLYAECDLEDSHYAPVSITAYNYNPFGITLLQNFFFGVNVASAVSALAHEAQHELESHIECTRYNNTSSCDYGYELFNPGIGFDDHSAYTITHWFYEDSMKSFFVDDQNPPQRLISRTEETDSNGNWQLGCRFKMLYSNYLIAHSWVIVSSDDNRFNIPKDVNSYLGISEMMDDINPKWVCSPSVFCRESDFTFNPEEHNNQSCNEILNPNNAQVNEYNRNLCYSAIGTYMDQLNSIDGQGPEASSRIHQEQIHQFNVNKRRCIPISEQQIDRYCESRLLEAQDAFNVDEYGFISDFSQSAADLCVQRFCQLPDQNELFIFLSDESFVDMWNRLQRDRYSEEENINFILNSGRLNNGKCPEYFCGRDLNCLKRYFTYGGNIELARGEAGYCTEQYLQCIEDSGENFRLENYPNFVVPDEFETISTEDGREYARINSYPCYEAYRNCKVRSSVNIGKILAQIYLEKEENITLIKKITSIESKVNPQKELENKLKPSAKESFTKELLFQLGKIENNSRGFVETESFYRWLTLPENISKFAHYVPREFLMFYPKEYSSYYAGDWIKKIIPLTRNEVIKDSTKLSSMFEIYERDMGILKKYNDKLIKQILFTASLNLTKEDFKKMIEFLYKAKTVDEQLKVLQEIEKISKI